MEVALSNGLNKSWTRLFFIFCQFFFSIFDDISKWSVQKAMRIFEKSSKMAKIWPKMKKNLVQFEFSTFLALTSGLKNLPISNTDLPWSPSLISIINVILSLELHLPIFSILNFWWEHWFVDLFHYWKNRYTNQIFKSQFQCRT